MVQVIALLVLTTLAVAAGAEPPEPALFIPGAVEIEILKRGGRRVQLADGNTVWMEPIEGDGWAVRYSCERPAERWQRVRDGFSIIDSQGGYRRVYDRTFEPTRTGYSDLTNAIADKTPSGYRVIRTEGTERFQHFPLTPKRR